MPDLIVIAFCLGALLGAVAGAAANSALREYRQRRMARKLLSEIDLGRLGNLRSDSQPGPMDRKSEKG